MSDAGNTQGDALAVQHAFADTVRDPSARHSFNFEARRLAVYQELFFNNVEGFAASAFPVLKEIIVATLGEENWLRLVRRFMVEHRCETPYFLQISEEFLRFLQHSMDAGNSESLPEYAWQLAHWEWMELHADVTPTESSMLISTLSDEQLLHANISLSETAWVCAYDYAVHTLDAEHHEVQAVPTYLMVYRNGQDDVGFNEINALSAALFETLRQQPDQTAEAVLLSLADASGLPAQTVLSGGVQILQQWQRMCIVFAHS